MKKIFTFLSAFLIISTPVFSASNSEETNKNIKKVVFENYVNNKGTREEYYFKNDKLSCIVIENIDSAKKNTNIRKYFYFDESQKLIKYSEVEEKKFEDENISKEIRDKAEILKKNVATKSNQKENEKNITTEIKREFDNAHKEILGQMDNMRKEIKKEMEDILKSF
ncbi:MAG: hypothetical protein IJG31_01670 [Fusobacterium sp.]|nr:hypothetical protein [Fusobacterium sp.]